METNVDGLVISQTGQVTAGTISKIVEYLLEVNTQSDLLDKFLVAYPHLIPPIEVWKVLTEKFRAKPASQKDSNVEAARKQRILTFLQNWIDKSLVRDFLGNKDDLYTQLLQFIGTLDQVTANKYKLLIVRAANRRHVESRQFKLRTNHSSGGSIEEFIDNNWTTFKLNESGTGSNTPTYSISNPNNNNSYTLSFTSGDRDSSSSSNSNTPPHSRKASVSTLKKIPTRSEERTGTLKSGLGSGTATPPSPIIPIRPAMSPLGAVYMSPGGRPSDPIRYEFLDIDEKQLAEQITLKEAEIFRQIKDSELLKNAWRIEDPAAKAKYARNVSKMVERFNQISFWVATEVVNITDIKNRSNAIKKYMLIAENLANLGNYNGLMEIVGGLNIFAVSRLKQTWEAAGSGVIKQFEDFNTLLESKSNYKNYRNHLKQAKLPVVPYLGIFLRDLIFMDENPSYKDSGKKVINFEKLCMIGDVILSLKKFQESVYPIGPHEPLQSYLNNLMYLPEEMLYKKSLECEPLANGGTPSVSGIEDSNSEISLKG